MSNAMASHWSKDKTSFGYNIPEDLKAEVVINGLETRSTGAHRQYVSYGLKPGRTYKYEIRARIVRGGRRIEDTRTVYLQAGARRDIAFRFAPEPDQAIAAL